jgi:uncharacterized protein (DUF305 family)
VIGDRPVRKGDRFMMRIHRVAVAAVVTGGLLAGCGGTTASGPATTTPSVGRAAPAGGQERHNQDDVVFLQDMLRHHSQTGTMSDLARAKATSLKVKGFATRIKAAQEQQITRIRNLLGAWGVQIPAGDGGDRQVPGMLSDQQLQQLKSATGEDFDQQFLRLMIDHQQGAIQMSQTELGQGSDPQARRLAQDTITEQQGNINQMQKLVRPS